MELEPQREVGIKPLKKIAVRVPNWLGDIVMSLNFLERLLCKYPDSEFILIVKPAYRDVLKSLSHPFSVVEFDKKSWPGLLGVKRFANKFVDEHGVVDRYYTLAPSFSSAFMGKLLAREVVGHKGNWRNLFLTRKVAFPPHVHRSQEYLALEPHLPERKLQPHSKATETRRRVILNINSEASSRRLKIEKWKEIIERLELEEVILIGGPGDRERTTKLEDLIKDQVSVVNVAGKTSILELMELIKEVGLVISNDSGPAHLAASLGAKVVVFFGAGDPNSTAPNVYQNDCLILNREVSCSPCLKNTCPLGHLDCLDFDSTATARSIEEYFFTASEV